MKKTSRNIKIIVIGIAVFLLAGGIYFVMPKGVEKITVFNSEGNRTDTITMYIGDNRNPVVFSYKLFPEEYSDKNVKIKDVNEETFAVDLIKGNKGKIELQKTAKEGEDCTFKICSMKCSTDVNIKIKNAVNEIKFTEQGKEKNKIVLDSGEKTRLTINLIKAEPDISLSKVHYSLSNNKAITVNKCSNVDPETGNTFLDINAKSSYNEMETKLTVSVGGCRASIPITVKAMPKPVVTNTYTTPSSSQPSKSKSKPKKNDGGGKIKEAEEL